MFFPRSVHVWVGESSSAGIRVGDYTISTVDVQEKDLPLWIKVYNILRQGPEVV